MLECVTKLELEVDTLTHQARNTAKRDRAAWGANSESSLTGSDPCPTTEVSLGSQVIQLLGFLTHGMGLTLRITWVGTYFKPRPNYSVSRSVMSDPLQPYGPQPTRLLCPWDSPGKNTRAGCHSLLQGIFPAQWLNLGLLHSRQILYHLSHQGGPF